MSPRPDRLTVLGSGTALPTARRGSPGYLLGFAGGRGVLMDPGPGSVRAAARLGTPLQRLTGALVTHFHPDHCLDLFALLFGFKNPALRSVGLTLIGPRGLVDLWERMGRVFGDWIRLEPERLSFVELEPGPFCVDLPAGRLEGEAVRMPHLGHSLGYRLRAERGILAYSGDTGLGEAPVLLGRDADHYVLEAAFPEGSDTSMHLTPETAAKVGADAGCRHLILTHFYPETEALDLERRVRRHFKGNLTLAEDGLSLEI